MRPVEMIFGKTGAVRVDIDESSDAMVICRNSLKGRENWFFTTNETGRKIAQWILDGKPGCVQDVFPELSIDQREMMISGMTPEEFEEATA